MNIKCPECQSDFKVPEEYTGKKVKCKRCGASFTVTGEFQENKAATSSSLDTNTETISNHLSPNNSKTTIADKLLRFSFSIANGISAFIVFLCLVSVSVLTTILITQFVIPTTKDVPEKFTSPTFEICLKQSEIENRQSKTRTEKQSKDTSTTNPSNNEFMSKPDESEILLQKICTTFKLDISVINEWVMEYYLEGYPHIFLKGLEAFLIDTEKYYVAKGVNPNTIRFMNGALYYKKSYDSKWNNYKKTLSEIGEENRAKRMAKEARISFCLTGLGGSISILLLFLFLPLLIQIEKNTRAFKQFVTQEE